MKYLVDASVLSEVTRPEPHPAVVEWLRKHERRITVTPIVLGEIEYGIGLTASTRKRKELERWFAEGMKRLRVIDLDADIASIWAALLVRLRKKGKPCP